MRSMGVIHIAACGFEMDQVVHVESIWFPVVLVSPQHSAGLFWALVGARALQPQGVFHVPLASVARGTSYYY